MGFGSTTTCTVWGLSGTDGDPTGVLTVLSGVVYGIPLVRHSDHGYEV